MEMFDKIYDYMEDRMLKAAKGKIAKLSSAVIMAMIFVFCATAQSQADEEAKSAREIVNKWNDVVISVKAVIKMRVVMNGREAEKSENETETTATIIDPSGLAVLSNSSIDPTRILGELLKQAQSAGENSPKYNFETDVTDVKMLFADGTEVPAKIVMRDRDLDLAFIAPKEKAAKPVHALDLSNEIKPAILDNIVILSRLGIVTGRATSVSMHRIEAAIKKPRIFYVIDQNASAGKLGAPVFSLDGKVVGVLLLRMMNSHGSGFNEFFGGMSRMGLQPIILPSDEILEVAKQALEKDKKVN